MAMCILRAIPTAAQNLITGLRAQNLITGPAVKATDANGLAALMKASRDGNLEGVQALLASGADVNTKTKCGATALLLAAGKGHLTVVQTLIAAHADIDAKMLKGATALIIASAHGHVEVVQALVAAGAQPSSEEPQTEVGSCGSYPLKAEGLLNPMLTHPPTGKTRR
jgi:ankyrin repeat protein